MNFRHVVLYNGYSLAENPQLSGVTNKKGEPVTGKFGDWEHVCAEYSAEKVAGGDLVYTRGRIATALQVAAAVGAECIIWSTGSTWLPNGISEAEYSLELAYALLPLCCTTKTDDWLSQISIVEKQSVNTATTMEYVRDLLHNHAVDRSPVMLHLVSSANHMPRVMRDAIKVFGRMPNITLSGVPADTSYGGKTPADVVIYELGEPVRP